MGKHGGKSPKEESGNTCSDIQVRQNSQKALDKDNEVFIQMAQELKEEGNKLFQRRDLEGAMLKYEKAIKLLPRNYLDVSHLRSNMATCYMQMGISEYPRAIHECNLALEVAPKSSKALLKRAKCYEALNKHDLCLRDVNTVLKMEPNNVMAGEVLERVTKTIEQNGINVSDAVVDLLSDQAVKQKPKRKKSKKVQAERKAEDKLVVEEKIASPKDECKRTLKLVFEDDIRWVPLERNCSFTSLTNIIEERFPSIGDVAIKFRDEEGDLVSITSDAELEWAEAAAESQHSLRLYLVKSKPEAYIYQNVKENKEKQGSICCIDEWIMDFARLFKDHVGMDSDACLSFHDLGSKVYSEAMEDAVTSDEAQNLFDMAGMAFQEMAAQAMFNWGNMHMSKAKKKLHLSENASKEALMEQIKAAYDWTQKEYSFARRRYEQALSIKPDFYEGFLALGHLQFEQARLIWYYAISTDVDLESWETDKVIQLYNCAEDNIERGMKLWEEFEEKRINKSAEAAASKQMNEGLSPEESNAQAKSIKSQMNVLWGTMLYERSVMEFKLGVPVWQECLEVAMEKFVLAGASPTDIAVVIKNHASNGGALEGLGFRIDEIVLAWNEMHEAKKLPRKLPSFRLEPLLRRRVSQLYHALEQT